MTMSDVAGTLIVSINSLPCPIQQKVSRGSSGITSWLCLTQLRRITSLLCPIKLGAFMCKFGINSRHLLHRVLYRIYHRLLHYLFHCILHRIFYCIFYRVFYHVFYHLLYRIFRGYMLFSSFPSHSTFS